jgi:hypothetical protein
MTDDCIALRELLETSADADLLREMIAFAERLMELEVQGPLDRRRLWRARSGRAGAAQRLIAIARRFRRPPVGRPREPAGGETLAGAAELRIPKLRRPVQPRHPDGI